MKRNHAVRGIWMAAVFIAILTGLMTGGCAGNRQDDLIMVEEGDGAGEESAISEEAVTGEAGKEPEEEPDLYVFVCGAVMEEGVYALPPGSRVIDAVEAAGGFREDADRTYVNQADYVADAQKLVIPTREEAKGLREQEAESPAGREDPGSGKGLVNINTADAEELMTLPGIGPARAESIIRCREENGPFQDPSDITKVSGIGQASYEKLKDYITAP